MAFEENEQTHVCSIVFLDIVQFLQQPGEVQFSWRIELSMLLDRCLEGVVPDSRIVSDTSSGAVIAFLLSAQDALSFVQRICNELPKLHKFALRIGVHLGSLRVVQESGGRPGVAGEGVNAAQRAMRFAGANEVLVSRVFQEEILRLTPGNASIFSPYGKQTGNLGREYDLFRMGLQPEPPALSGVPGSPEPSSLPGFSVSPESLSLPELTVSPAPIEPLAPSTRDAMDMATTPPVAQSSPGFSFKVALGAVVLVITAVWLWFVLDGREHDQTAPSAVSSARQDPAVTMAAPKVDDFLAAPELRQEGAATPEKPRLAVVPAPGKGGTAKKDQRSSSGRCSNCSCTDLMTKLSLGDVLNETERRYMAERCKK